MPRAIQHGPTILRVPETRFGVSERTSAGSSGGHLMLLLAVSTPPRIGGVALPLRRRKRVGGCLSFSGPRHGAASRCYPGGLGFLGFEMADVGRGSAVCEQRLV